MKASFILQTYSSTAHHSLNHHIWSYPYSKKVTDRGSGTSEVNLFIINIEFEERARVNIAIIRILVK